jgi:hypothetical protein
VQLNIDLDLLNILIFPKNNQKPTTSNQKEKNQTNQILIRITTKKSFA